MFIKILVSINKQNKVNDIIININSIIDELIVAIKDTSTIKFTAMVS